MENRNSLRKRIMRLAAATIIMLSVPCGCAEKKKTAENSGDGQSRSIAYESHAERTETDGSDSTDSPSQLPTEQSGTVSGILIPIHTSASEERHDELEYRVISIYNSTDIKTGEEHQLPPDGKQFFIAELELINNTDEMISFRSSFDLIPSVDDNVLSMSGYKNEFPLVLNGYKSLQSSLEIPVYKHSSVTGYIGFEGPLQFGTVELTFCGPFGVTDSFRFSGNVTDTAASPAPLAKGDANGFETAVYECSVSDGSGSGLSPAKEGFCYLSLKAEMKNISDRILKADTNELRLVCGDKSYDNIFSDTNSLYVPPGKHIGRTAVIQVPAGADKLTLVQTGAEDTVLLECALTKK